MRGLITGFKPFGKHDSNISELVVDSLESLLELADPYGLADNVNCTIDTLILSVDESGSKTVSELSTEYDFILHLGLCEKCEYVRIETKAHNELDFRIPDNSGRLISSQSIITNQEDLETSLPVRSWDLGLVSTELELSDDAGRYLCNETYYRSLNAKECDVLFVHLPQSTLANAMSAVLDILSLIVHPPVVEVVAGLIRRENGEMLALRRAPEVPHPGKWEIPGGRIEEGEDSARALKRELLEELSIDAKIGEYIGVWEETSTIRLRLHVHEVYSEQSPKLSVHDMLRWGMNLSELEWIGLDRRILHDINAM